MMIRRVVIMFGLCISATIACKTASREIAEPQESAPLTVAPIADTPAPITPSARYHSMPDLVTPGPDEVLIRRGPRARCPTGVEIEAIERGVQALGRETIDLVQEDLLNLRRTSSRTDREGISSCCNQLEQLVQDTEIMNEDKASAVPELDKIRKTTLMLCPPT